MNRRSRPPAPCDCGLCRRHRRLRYVQDVLRRVGDEPSAAWLDVMFDAMLDTDAELEMANAYIDYLRNQVPES